MLLVPCQIGAWAASYRGTPGVKSTADGWLNRALQAEDIARHQPSKAFRAVALGAQVPRTLSGKMVQIFGIPTHPATMLPTASTSRGIVIEGGDS